MKKRVLSILNTRAVFYVALFLFAASSFSTFWYGHVTGFSDEGHYWSLARGMHHGKFSAWYFLPVSTPDTLRTWGYPFFLYLCQFFSSSYLFVQVIQLVVFFITIALALRLIKHFYAPLAYRTVFILLLVLNNHLAFYAGILVAECLFIFFIVLFVYIYTFYRDSYLKFILLGLVCFVLFQLRPIFLFFPFFFFIYLFFQKRLRLYTLVYLAVFIVSLIPFGLWNKSNHGVFKITPLEGGYGAMYQSGYWEYRLPIGFTAPYYWGMQIDHDILQPQFISAAEKQTEKIRYINEWEGIIKELKEKHYTPEDSVRAQWMRDTTYRPLRNFEIYSSSYTIAREKILKEKTWAEIKQNPFFYIKTRIYQFFRQWVTGINADQLQNASGIKGYVKALYPFVITFIFILCGLILIGIQLLRRKLSWQKFHLFFLLIGYFAVMNLPFGAMSRYTVPVHLFILMLLSICLVNLTVKPVPRREKL